MLTKNVRFARGSAQTKVHISFGHLDDAMTRAWTVSRTNAYAGLKSGWEFEVPGRVKYRSVGRRTRTDGGKIGLEPQCF
jgi:hypothetical protein